ncbi:hypothetical protein E2C01_029196 [Portunus trituberculatus]|uniref:Uncharacterized protein n=1 Tax=Portunus trituberculatus TaxID=210409 RepID=A0A5B7EMP5_PORTR|nr:hypothetical protein [Portunus trituberculatus]
MFTRGFCFRAVHSSWRSEKYAEPKSTGLGEREMAVLCCRARSGSVSLHNGTLLFHQPSTSLMTLTSQLHTRHSPPSSPHCPSPSVRPSAGDAAEARQQHTTMNPSPTALCVECWFTEW